MIKNNLGRHRRLCLTCPDHSPSLKDIKAELNQEQKQEPQKKSDSWLASSGLLSYVLHSPGHLPKEWHCQ